MEVSRAMLVRRTLNDFFRDGDDYQTAYDPFMQRKEGQKGPGWYQSSILTVVILLASPKGALAYVEARANNEWRDGAA